MKYSEFLQLDELLTQNGITWGEFKKDPQLYEGVLGQVGSYLWNLAKKGMQNAVSAGLEPKYKEQLNKKAEQIQNWVTSEIEKAQNNQKHVLYSLFNQKSNLEKNKNDEKGDDALKEKKKKLKLFDKEISKFIHKNVEKQSNRVERSIEQNKMLSDNTKQNLQDYWEDLQIQIELATSVKLQEKNIFSNETPMDDIAKLINKYKKEDYETKNSKNTI